MFNLKRLNQLDEEIDAKLAKMMPYISELQKHKQTEETENKNTKEADRWIKQGERDLKAAKELLKSRLYEVVCFHSQQSAEKVLKGLLYARGYRAIVTHSVRELFKKAKKEFKMKEMLNECIELDKEYIPPRYPDAFPSGSPYEYYTKEDAIKCINYAESILREVKRLRKNLKDSFKR